MRFSLLIGEGRYRIGLRPGVTELLDQLFNGGSHHFWMARNTEVGTPDHAMHSELSQHHCQAIVRIIAQGDFSRAFDPDHTSLDSPAGWLSPTNSPILSGDFFCNMLPDPRYHLGEPHPADRILTSFDPSTGYYKGYYPGAA